MRRLFKQAGDGVVGSLGTERARRLSRRDFLKATGMAGGGLMLAIGLPADGGPGGRTARAQEAAAKVPYPPAAFVRIGTDDSVTVLVNKQHAVAITIKSNAEVSRL